MQAVILAAGKGTRMGALTESMPKAMLPVAGKPLLEHKIEMLPPVIDEVILVIGYYGGVIHDHFGGSFNGKRILYVEQETFDGTGGALWRAKDILKDRFLVLMADDLYSPGDLKTLAAQREWTLLVAKTDGGASGGAVVTDAKHNITEVTEGQHRSGALTSTNAFLLDTRLFDQPMVAKTRDSEEFGLPQTVAAAAHTLRLPFLALPATSWIQISSPDDILRAEREIDTLH